MEVVFCVNDHRGRYKVTAHGKLGGIPEPSGIGLHVGQVLPFEITADMSDLQRFAERLPRGIVRLLEEEGDFYDFEVLSGRGMAGQLRLLGVSQEVGCLPADAE